MISLTRIVGHSSEVSAHSIRCIGGCRGTVILLSDTNIINKPKGSGKASALAHLIFNARSPYSCCLRGWQRHWPSLEPHHATGRTEDLQLWHISVEYFDLL